MEAKRLKADLFLVLISSFILIVCWIGFNIYNHAVTSTIDETLARQITPIDPSFDMNAIENLNQRRKVSPLYQLENLSPTPSVSPIPTSFPTPSITQQLVPTETPEELPETEIQSTNPISSEGADLIQ